MTVKTKKTKRRIPQSRRIARLHASSEDDLFWLADGGLAGGETEAEPRWNRPRKQRISLRVDCEVVDWFKSRARIPDTDQPDIATGNDGSKETGTAPLKPKPRLSGRTWPCEDSLANPPTSKRWGGLSGDNPKGWANQPRGIICSASVYAD